ncbi:hypothetical protein ACNSOL_00730 [Aliarcobacter lanthieri]|uniref:hypothetical protein n=1 Tax=Aliarcobacter lanthieri TaxID=1355374 RepID=UPI003AAF857D
MIIIGDNLVPYEEIFFISRIEEIKNTKPNSILVFNYDEAIVKYCFQNSLNFAVIVENLKEAIYANSLNAKYIISKIKLAKKIQKVAENYMFDSKILAIIDSNDELENIAKKEIDGIIYRKLLA